MIKLKKSDIKEDNTVMVLYKIDKIDEEGNLHLKIFSMGPTSNDIANIGNTICIPKEHINKYITGPISDIYFAYDNGIKDMHHAVSMIVGKHGKSQIPHNKLSELFNDNINIVDIINNFKGIEIVEKIEKFEDEVNLNVGDEIYFSRENCSGYYIVSSRYDEEGIPYIDCINKESGHTQRKIPIYKTVIKKTGKHYELGFTEIRRIKIMPKLIVDFPDDEIIRIKDNYYPASLFNIMTPIRYALENNEIYDDLQYEKGYDAGIQEMYRALFRIVGIPEGYLTDTELDNIFGTHKCYGILSKFSAKEIIDKIKEYEKEQEKYTLNKGDEVIWTAGENNEYTRTGIVISVKHFKGVTRYSIIDKNTYDTYDRLIRDGEKQDMYTKTGKRYKINFLDNLEEEEKNNEK